MPPTATDGSAVFNNGIAPAQSATGRIEGDVPLVASLPFLRISETGAISTNLLQCKKKWAPYAIEKYGAAAQLIEDNAHYVLSAVEKPVLSDDADKYDKAEALEGYKERVKIRIRREAELEAQYPKIYAFIIGQTSAASKGKLEAQDEWPSVRSSRDPLMLWRLIVRTHLGQASGCKELDCRRARDAYNKIRMAWNETIHCFKERFDNAINTGFS